MTPRSRRLAALVALGIAGAATLATSQPMPTPSAIVDEDLSGRLELGPDSLVAVQEFHLRLDAPGIATGGVPTVLFEPTIVRAGDAGDDEVRLRVVSTDPNTKATGFSVFRGGLGDQPAPTEWHLSCAQVTSCTGAFAVIAEWVDPDSAAAATIDWSLAAKIGVWTGDAAAAATIDFATDGDAVRPAVSIATGAGEPVRMDAKNRLAQWRVSLQLGSGELTEPPAWPLVVSARLRPTSTVVTGPDEGDPSQPLPFIDGPDDVTNLAHYPTAAGDVDFEPFYRCQAAEVCSADYLIGLKWLDSRLETAVDAGWELDVRAIGADGVEVPVSIEVAPIPAMAMAVGTAAGTLVWNRDRQDSYQYLVSVPVGDSTEEWQDARLPTYGIWRATITSTGSTPLMDDFGVNFGKYGGERRLTIGDGEIGVGFEANDDRPCRIDGPEPCRIDRGLGIGFDADDLPNGGEFTISWELEIGAGTTEPAPAPLRIVNVTDATPRP